MDKVKIGFPLEYEDNYNIIRNGLFLREPEIKELEKKLKEINKITDLKEQVKKQKEVIDKIKSLKQFYIKDFEERNITMIPLSNLTKNIDIVLKEVSE